MDTGRTQRDEFRSESPDSGSAQILLAEYAALRAEVERRTGVQWSVFALQLGSAGAIASFAISATVNPAVLLLIPFSSYLLGSRYILHDHHIKLIHGYIQGILSPRLNGDLGWEAWKAVQVPSTKRSGWLAPTNWNPLHPTRLAFVGVAVLALLSAAVGAIYHWHRHTPPALILVCGFAALWLIGVVATVWLNMRFEEAGKP